MSDAPLTEKELTEKREKALEKAKKSVALAEKIEKSRAAVATRYAKIQERERKVAAALDKLNARHETAMKKLTRAEARAAKLAEAVKTDVGGGPEGV